MRPLVLGTVLVVLSTVLGIGSVARAETPLPHVASSSLPSTSLKKVVINEAVHTLLYLPLYHAIEKNYFRDEGIQVDILNGGTATNSFAAMLSGETVRRVEQSKNPHFLLCVAAKVLAVLFQHPVS